MTMQADSNTLQNDVFARLRMGIQQFPTQQKTICSYILNNHQKVAFYTVEELGRASDTSPATVVRVVKRLGYDSYKELLEDLQKTLKYFEEQKKQQEQKFLNDLREKESDR